MSAVCVFVCVCSLSAAAVVVCCRVRLFVCVLFCHQVGSNDDCSFLARWSCYEFVASSSSVYYIQVDGFYGTTGFIVLEAIYDGPPNDGFARYVGRLTIGLRTVRFSPFH